MNNKPQASPMTRGRCRRPCLFGVCLARDDNDQQPKESLTRTDAEPEAQVNGARNRDRTDHDALSSSSATLRNNTPNAQHALLPPACTAYTAWSSHSRGTLTIKRYACMSMRVGMTVSWTMSVGKCMRMGLVLGVAMGVRMNMSVGVGM